MTSLASQITFSFILGRTDHFLSQEKVVWLARLAAIVTYNSKFYLKYICTVLQQLLKSQKRAFLSITLEWFKDVVDRYCNYLMVSD